MKAFVFTDESLREQAGRFVWLELNVDKPENAEIRNRLGVRALPTYFVLEPESERIVLRWIGGTTAPQLGHLLDTARENVARVRSGDPAPDPSAATADDLLAQADLLYGEGKGAEAAELYERSIATAPEDWPAYSRAVEALLLAWLLGGSCDQAAPFAREVHPRLANSPSVAIVAGVGLDCALELPDDDPTKSDLVSYLEDACREATEDLSIPMAADDRSGLFISRLSARKAAEDSLGARAVAERWIEFLDREAERAPDPGTRTVFDSHRLFACRELGTPERAIPFLQRSQSDFPEDYNPPARLALAFKDLGRWDEALAASTQAVDLAYGPRLVSLLGSRADLLLSSGDAEAARATLLEAIETEGTLPEAQRSERRVESLREKLGAIP